jgi:hypothetical protein
MTDVLVELDNRRRASLGRLGNPEHRYYLGHTEPDGRIVLVPAVVMPEAEARLRGNPELLGQIEHTVAEPASRVRRARRQ